MLTFDLCQWITTLQICHMKENFMPIKMIRNISPNTGKLQSRTWCRVTKMLKKYMANNAEAIQLYAPKIGVAQ